MSSTETNPGSFLSDDPSFSVIYFSSDIREFVASLLANCGYQIVERAAYNGPFRELLGQIERSPARTIVNKAAYSVSSGTVLLDPEMVVGAVDDAPLQAFCDKHRTVAWVAIWERFTKSVIARRISASGIEIDFLSVNGVTPRKPINAPPDLIRWPTPDHLRGFLSASGASIDQIFGNVSAQIFKLDEAKMAPS